MKFSLIAEQLKNIPHMSIEQGKIIYDFVLFHNIVHPLELGFAHGTSSCFIAAALDERKSGLLITIDLKGALSREPNIYALLQTTGLSKYVSPIFVDTSYNWELLKIIEGQTKENLCVPLYDFCFIDGAHTWVDDGFAFTLVDKLLKPESWILFDDIDWSYSNSPTLSGMDWVRRLPEVQQKTPQIRKVFDSLVRQHPNYDQFKVEENWGWAHKRHTGVTQVETKTNMIIDEKGLSEMAYWRGRLNAEGVLKNSHYEPFYTSHFGFDHNYYKGKRILDIGCGPRGSLEWAHMTTERVGIDPLADLYKEFGTEKHGMKYVPTGSENIPFLNDYFDVVASFNSLDHVDNLDKTIAEIKRILKPGGFFLLITELNHEPTDCEPIAFSWDIIEKFTDVLTLIDEKHFERSKSGIYDSIPANISYDHSNPTKRYGILSAKFQKNLSIKGGEVPCQSFDRLSSVIPTISVIIPVLNAAETLSKCLDSLATLEYPAEKLEIIVVDNGSTDNSIDIAKSFKVKLLYQHTMKSSYAARNVGIQAANGELVAFTDADCIVTPTWLSIISKEYSESSVGCFAGEIEAFEPKSLVEKYSHRHGTLRQRGTLTCQYLPYTQTANSVYRREVFEKIGLFNPEIVSGGDADLAWRMQKQLGLKIKFIPEALVYHKHRSSIIGLYQQYKKYEKGKLLWKKFYPDYNLPSLNQRKVELIQWSKKSIRSFPENIVNYFNRKIDFIDLVSPFLRVIMAYGTYTARKEKISN
ncbi:MAG: hypothetical protein C0417_12305 [Chlorobiaceae bacterium]|nr:hypothetical protein [Chlorobiaceae bacterium]